MTVEEQNLLAQMYRLAYVDREDGGAPAYVDSGAGVLYEWAGVRLTENLPLVGIISSGANVFAPDDEALTIEFISVPVRHRDIENGKARPGYFEPRERIFLQWRGVVRDQDPTVPMVDPRDIDRTVEIDPPA